MNFNDMMHFHSVINVDKPKHKNLCLGVMKLNEVFPDAKEVLIADFRVIAGTPFFSE